jgi:hypothetical protein
MPRHRGHLDVHQILEAQAQQFAACGDNAKCQANIGKLLSANRVISGKVTKFAADAWQVYATLVNVETGQTLKAESVRFRGDLPGLLDKPVLELAEKIGK